MNKKGITFISIVITVAVLLILTTTIVVSSDGILKSTKKKEFANELYNIQKLVDNYYFRNNEYPVKDIDVTINLSTMTNDEKLQFSTEDVVSESVILKELDLYEAGVNETNRGQGLQANDKYLVSENTGIVYYQKGEKHEEITYYTLTNELREEIGAPLK